MSAILSILFLNWDDMEITRYTQTMNIVQAAVNMRWIRKKIFWYDDTDFYSDDLGDAEILQFKPWRGYIIYARVNGLSFSIPSHILSPPEKMGICTDA